MDPGEKARMQLQKLQQRLAKSRDRLAEARNTGEEDKIIEALAATVERLEGKVAAAEEQTEQAGVS